MLEAMAYKRKRDTAQSDSRSNESIAHSKKQKTSDSNLQSFGPNAMTVDAREDSERAAGTSQLVPHNIRKAAKKLRRKLERQKNNNPSTIAPPDPTAQPMATDSIVPELTAENERSSEKVRKSEKREKRRVKRLGPERLDGRSHDTKQVNGDGETAQLLRDTGDNNAGDLDGGERSKKEMRKQKRLRKEEKQRAQDVPRSRPRTRKKSKDIKPQAHESSSWRLSNAVGGHMRDSDPVFSKDEKYLLVAYVASIIVYSTSTSLAVRSLQPRKAENISAFALSISNPNQLYLSTNAGTIELWDFIEGARIFTWKLSSSIFSLATAQLDAGLRKPTGGDIEGKNNDPGTAVRKIKGEVVYVIDKKGDGPWMMSAHRLRKGEDVGKSEVTTLFKQEKALSPCKVLEGGQIIVATSGEQLIIGTSTLPEPSNLRELSYVWRILECPEWVASFDVRLRPTHKSDQGSKNKSLLRDALDVAIGGLKGSIYIYDDILKKLFRKERASRSGNPENIDSRRLHWHRNSVLAVNWSLDGNYLISGGRETVLVLWQLETGRKQELPHLGAPLESIVVSPSGSTYAIRLADNSAMILSTSELKPIFSIAGIQVPAAREDTSNILPFLPTVDTPSLAARRLRRVHYPACTSLSNNHLLLAVPPSVSGRQSTSKSKNASYLQILDVDSAQQISRQALTRTNITTLAMGPESNVLEEPNITHIQVSFDGQWLATVDEWMPPRRDVDLFSFDSNRAAEEQIFRQEIHLNFWLWNEEDKVWELVSRVDDPHSSPSGNPYEQGRVLELVSDPSSIGFATIGQDGIVKTWMPAVRRRNGLEIKSKKGKSLGTWHCKRAIPIESAQSHAADDILGAKLAFSHDGSILAVGLQSATLSPIYIIDSYKGDFKTVHTGLYSGALFGLGIVNKYLVTLANELCVWDLVTDERQYGIHLNDNGLSLGKRWDSTHLTVDVEQEIFAIAVPEAVQTANVTAMKSQLAIFDPDNPEPLERFLLPSTVTSLLATNSKKAFLLIDSAANIQTLTPGHQPLPPPPKAIEQEPSRGLSDIFGNGEKRAFEEAGTYSELLNSDKGHLMREPNAQADEKVYVSANRLAEVFDVGSSHAMPPVMELFEQVASLYNGRASA
ncbi:hypothetical protein MMC21_000904 [Puttea exsequens]|nr:hypothetical protein [Puttea exsequens]